jgi:hypothetical protein
MVAATLASPGTRSFRMAAARKARGFSNSFPEGSTGGGSAADFPDGCPAGGRLEPRVEFRCARTVVDKGFADAALVTLHLQEFLYVHQCVDQPQDDKGVATERVRNIDRIARQVALPTPEVLLQGVGGSICLGFGGLHQLANDAGDADQQGCLYPTHVGFCPEWQESAVWPGLRCSSPNSVGQSRLHASEGRCPDRVGLVPLHARQRHRPFSLPSCFRHHLRCLLDHCDQGLVAAAAATRRRAATHR